MPLQTLLLLSDYENHLRRWRPTPQHSLHALLICSCRVQNCKVGIAFETWFCVMRVVTDLALPALWPVPFSHLYFRIYPIDRLQCRRQIRLRWRRHAYKLGIEDTAKAAIHFAEPDRGQGSGQSWSIGWKKPIHPHRSTNWLDVFHFVWSDNLRRSGKRSTSEDLQTGRRDDV